MPYKDKTKQKEYYANYYQSNKDKRNKQTNLWVINNKEKRKEHSMAYARKAKLKMLAYVSTCCMSCGYNTYYGALEFHHINPEEKELKLSETAAFTDKVKAELDKCVVLCANCHREVHAGIRKCPSPYSNR